MNIENISLPIKVVIIAGATLIGFIFPLSVAYSKIWENDRDISEMKKEVVKIPVYEQKLNDIISGQDEIKEILRKHIGY
ncbi:MAG: hypothetical protein WC332_02740 [Clostridia bacterium]|jgi:hypothetical protein